MIKAIIVDDEKAGRDFLELLIQQEQPGVEVVAKANSVDQAEKLIVTHQPNLIFLDIEMPKANGFELLKRFDPPLFDVIFTTAYSEYAIQAIKKSALDYLLKPIDPNELVAAIQKVQKKNRSNDITKSIENLSKKIDRDKSINRISIATNDGLEFITTDEIVSINAATNYSELYLDNGKVTLVSKPISEFEENLPSSQFIRVHRSYILNITKIVKYISGRGGYAITTLDTKIPVAMSKKAILLDALTKQPY